VTPATSIASRHATVLAVTSGKGGVGKTNVVVNVAVALARLGYRIGVLDADFGLGNVDVLLGLTPTSHVGHLLSGEKPLRDVVVGGPRGVKVVPAGSGLRSLTALSATQRQRLQDAVADLRVGLDFLVIDTASGISDNVVETVRLAERIVVVTSLEPSSIVDAYALIKVITAAAPSIEIGLTVNGARDAVEAGVAFRQLHVAAMRFLGRAISFYGFILEDPALRDALLVQRAMVEHSPESPASRCYRSLASRLAGLGPVPAVVRPEMRPAETAAIEVPQCA
jgi:flagellar biosynthesis protein FlhG